MREYIPCLPFSLFLKWECLSVCKSYGLIPKELQRNGFYTLTLWSVLTMGLSVLTNGAVEAGLCLVRLEPRLPWNCTPRLCLLPLSGLKLIRTPADTLRWQNPLACHFNGHMAFRPVDGPAFAWSLLCCRAHERCHISCYNTCKDPECFLQISFILSPKSVP